MSLEKIRLPNVRKLFIPDPGYVIYEADLAGADAQVVAAEAEDRDLLTAFAQGLDVHDKNATDLFGAAYSNLSGGARKNKRKQSKQAVHATNYGASARTVGLTLGWSMRDAEDFQRRWFRLHPGIKSWHERVYLDLQQSRTARNKFGYRIVYFDRVDGLLPQALAWIPQSTVALVSFRGMKNLKTRLPHVRILLQVHDSVLFQFPKTDLPTDEEILSTLAAPIPYREPLTIPWNLAKSEKSWGDCK